MPGTSASPLACVTTTGVCAGCRLQVEEALIRCAFGDPGIRPITQTNLPPEKIIRATAGHL